MTGGGESGEAVTGISKGRLEKHLPGVTLVWLLLFGGGDGGGGPGDLARFWLWSGVPCPLSACVPQLPSPQKDPKGRISRVSYQSSQEVASCGEGLETSARPANWPPAAGMS